MAKLGKPAHLQFLELLSRAEKEGWGFHEQIVKAAGLMKRLGVNPELASEMMETAGEKVTRRRMEPGEVRRVVNWIYSGEAEVRPYDNPKAGVKVEQKLIDEFSKGGSIEHLKAASGPIPQTAKDILEELYDEAALLHLSAHHCQPRDVKTRKQWTDGDLSDRQYICPAHLKSIELGRCKANVDYRHWIVYESDRVGLAGNWNAQAGVIKRLSRELPLKLVTWSGNVSLHSWFDCRTRRKDHVQDFISLCVQLGADPACLRPAQLVRLPWGIRSSNQKIQKVIYYAN